MKKLENQVRNEIFRQMSLTSTLALDVLVRPMDAKGLILNCQEILKVMDNDSRPIFLFNIFKNAVFIYQQNAENFQIDVIIYQQNVKF